MRTDVKNTRQLRWLTDMARLCLALACLLWGGALRVKAADHYVATNGSAVSPYLNWANAATNIQDAVNVALAGETVWASNGTYYLTGQVEITSRIILKSANGWSNTLAAADWPAYTTRCFYVIGEGVLDGFSISNGHWYGSNNYSGGGGAYIGGSGRVQNCYFVKNVCSNSGTYVGGGGAYVKTGTIDNCRFFFNNAYKPAGGSSDNNIGDGCGYGGGVDLRERSFILNSIVISNISGVFGSGIYAPYQSGAIISNCLVAYNNNKSGVFCGRYALLIDSVVSNNWGWDGAGVSVLGGTVMNCTIVNNYCYWYGGGISMSWGGFASNCSVSGNTGSQEGGGIYVAGGPYNYEVDKCRISNNFCTAGKGGGGVFLAGGQLRNSLICNNTNRAASTFGGGLVATNAASQSARPYGVFNCTIVNNYSTNEGGGIAALGLTNYIVNCIFAGNRSSANNYPDVYNTGENSNYYHHCAATNVLFAPNQGNVTNDPVFINANGGDYRLRMGSPCVNTGTNLTWMTNTLDLAGQPRILNEIVDMGAYERYVFQGAVFTGY